MMKSKNTMKVLHYNDFGNIAKCNCCDDLQLTLGNVLIPFTNEEYTEFDEFFDEIRADFKEESKRKRRQYVIRTNKNGLTLVLSYKQLRDTIELLNFSTIMLAVNKLTTV